MTQTLMNQPCMNQTQTNQTFMNQTFIAGDWGSSNVRFFLFKDGKVADLIKTPDGISKIKPEDCPRIFAETCKEWLNKFEISQVILAGMIGSDRGWKDAGYIETPVSLSALKHQRVAVPNSLGLNISIIPGLCVKENNNFNVMRGEETQLVGAVQIHPCSCYLMPGTHCKWVRMQSCGSDEVVSFRTSMTGEMHHLLMQYSLVAMGAGEQKTDHQAFLEGLDSGLSDDTLLPRLFELRAGRVLGQHLPSSVSDRLSGLLIGSEIRSMLKLFALDKNENVGLIGNSMLNARYAEALSRAGFKTINIDGDQAFEQGISNLALNSECR